MAQGTAKGDSMEIHESLYVNIQLLTELYAPSKMLQDCLSPDMFLKPNKEAFQEVTYFLLKTLDPKSTKEQITWPLYDKKTEAKFRLDATRYINSLNKKYEYANIPTVLTSYLMTPCGDKFVNILWKLSMLVVSEHLRRTDENEHLFYPMRARRNPEKVLENFETFLRHKKHEIYSKCVNDIQVCEKHVNVAKTTYESFEEITRKMGEEKEKYKEYIKNNSTEEISIGFYEKLNQLNDSMLKLKQFENNINTVHVLLEKLNNSFTFEYENNSLTIPESLKSELVLQNTDRLNMIDFLTDIKKMGMILVNESSNQNQYNPATLINFLSDNDQQLKSTINFLKQCEPQLKMYDNEYREKLAILSKKIEPNSNVSPITNSTIFEDSPTVTLNLPTTSKHSSSFTSSQSSFKEKFVTPMKLSTIRKQKTATDTQSEPPKYLATNLFPTFENISPIGKMQDGSRNRAGIKQLIANAQKMISNSSKEECKLHADCVTILEADKEIRCASTPMNIFDKLGSIIEYSHEAPNENTESGTSDLKVHVNVPCGTSVSGVQNIDVEKDKLPSSGDGKKEDISLSNLNLTDENLLMVTNSLINDSDMLD